ncbi:MAG: DinB family protein [Terriglobales bacterium]
MPINELLLSEFDEEIKKTRTMLERVPEGKKDFAPHPKSMPLGKLAPHVAQLTGFGLTVLTTPELDFAKTKFAPVPFESAAQLVKTFDDGAAKTRDALKTTPDEAWTQPWKLSAGDITIFKGSRFMAYRQMFLNHLVHHRAQLGVYLRLNETPVPATYGPSADDKMGF